MLMRTYFIGFLLVGAGGVGFVCADPPPSAQAPAQPEAAHPAFGTLNLPELWQLALANNPELREAEAEIEAARGELIQAGKYPNPKFAYSEENIGTRENSAGFLKLEMSQEILTAGKRRLDIAIAQRGMDEATLANISRRFDVLTRIRRAYFEYLGWRQTEQVYTEVTAGLQEGVDITRKQVEKLGTRPRSDLLRLEALFEESKIGQEQSKISRDSAWQQLGAEVGVSELHAPEIPGEIAVPVPHWESEAILHHTLAVHSDLLLGAASVDRARLEVNRARAEAVPNVNIGGGYSHDYAERLQGGVVMVEVPVPLWDRKQGRIQASVAKLDRAEAARRSVSDRLERQVAEAYGRYEGSRIQAERLNRQVLPRLTESLELVRKGYQAGAREITFADVLLAEQNLNDARLKLAQTRRDLWRALADLQGLMQLDVGDELGESPCGMPPH
jgi:outer membrane protein, heavy metal efflux system